MLLGGILPFGAIFIELYFIMNSIWFHKMYYVFGFLFLVYLMVILTCSEVTVLICYFHLCSEEYRWSWKAFLTSGASALYVFLYSIIYVGFVFGIGACDPAPANHIGSPLQYFTRLQSPSFVSTVIYFGYTTIMTIMFFVLTGMSRFCVLAFSSRFFTA